MNHRSIVVILPVLILSIGIVTIFASTAGAAENIDLEKLDGDGTEENPYIITTAEELQAINQDLEAHYVLENDIDASQTNSWNGGAGFKPIGDSKYGDREKIPFSGTVDGQDHSITGLTIDRSGETYSGLFGEVSGEVKNINLKNIYIRGNEYTGGITGSLAGEIRRVSVTGVVETTEEYAGGIAGRTREDPSLEKAYVDIESSGREHIGGIYGAGAGTVTESYATGTVEASESRVGGLIGNQYSGGAVRQSYATVDVKGGIVNGGAFGNLEGTAQGVYTVGTIDKEETPAGGFAGGITSNTPRPTAVYWDTSVAKTQEGIGSEEQYSTGLDTSEMTSSNSKSNMDLDFENFWAATDEYPVLQWQVQDVDLRVSQSSIGEGETTSVTVELTLNDGSTVTASEVADYDSETAVASVSDGTLEANSVGQTELTATVAGESDSVTVEVLKPPNIEFSDAEFDTEAAVEGTTVDATVTYENTGGPGSETTTVTVDGETVATKTVHVDADSETTESIQWTAQRNGTVAVDGEPVGDLSIVDPETIALESISLPDEAAQDSEYDIGLEFNNTASNPVVDTVELRVNGETAATERVEVGAGESTEMITYAHDQQGTATHVVEHHSSEETGTTEILEPATFSLEDLTVSETIPQGETETITGTVTNTGGSDGTDEIALKIGDDQTASQSVTLDSGESKQVEFTQTVDESGEKTVTLASSDDELETTIAVESDESTPGFGIVAGLVALVLLGMSAVRRH